MPPGVVLVTGGSRGIGAATVRAAAAAGWPVALTFRDDAAAADGVVAEVEAAGRAAVAVRADVSVEDDVLAAFAAAERLGPVTGLVANAGIVGARARVDELTAERVQRVLAVNVLGAVLCCREAVRRMSTRHGGAGGSVVLVSSAASRLGSPGEYREDPRHSPARGGTLQGAVAEGVRVNVVRPGIIETEIHASGGQPDRVARVGPTVPMGRAGRAEEVAAPSCGCSATTPATAPAACSTSPAAADQCPGRVWCTASTLLPSGSRRKTP
ncbi:NAD(P)-dependent dehydrogenase, short-chain alcohol dehydrogenase family [Geodermatophilus pulveris]|uniref:NAD(P)-dependent dehydrogenase, short-chain alcohol dehydrogenase family n=1 Tax=Geodermatophilus pulveris TaxID=1564159 RepID=A0A239HW98_9ACTN|nr:SDR family NAD(P)-dependent oxidoreductase [Geodermatophilus pulveris]SNS85552.1 NAD(P)-dependent dehydrogenase, short-chain alcohol dehydrogenase family [Geodermatophilus pulveris]